MAQPQNQVQTEATNLAVVVEDELGNATPPATGWHNIEPHSYGAFGPQYKKLARDPITKNMQLLKSMLVDEDSGIVFETDVTKDSVDRFASGIFRCVPKHAGNKGKSSYKISSVAADGFNVDGLGDLDAGTLVKVRGCKVLANNGLHVVAAGSVDGKVNVASLTVESSVPANAELEVAGFRFASGDLTFDSDGNLNCTAASFLTKGLHELQFIYVGNDEDANHSFATAEFLGTARIAMGGISAHKLTLDCRTWDVGSHAFLDLGGLTSNIDTIVESPTAGAGGNDVRVKTLDDGDPATKASLDLATKTTHVDTVIQAKASGVDGNDITVEFTAGAGTAAGSIVEVGTNVTIHYKATATASTVADIEALIATSTLIEVKTPGTGATSLNGADAFAAAALAGGTDADAPSVSESGNDVTIHFTGNFSTVAEIEAAITAEATLIRVKTEGTAGNIAQNTVDEFAFTNLDGGESGADDGAGKTIDLFYSRFYRNVAKGHADYLEPSYCFEVEYPTLDDGSPEYEYLLGNMVDMWVWTFGLTTKATISATFKGTRSHNPTTDRFPGPADALDPNAKVGLSTSTDLSRLRMSNVDETGISTDWQSIKLTTKNNVNPIKKLGVLGAVSMSLGKHTVESEIDAIFTSDEIIKGIRDNRDATLDVLMRNPDFGAVLNIQAMTLDSGDRKMERNKIVLITSKQTGHMNDLSSSTESLSVFAHLPTPASQDF